MQRIVCIRSQHTVNIYWTCSQHTVNILHVTAGGCQNYTFFSVPVLHPFSWYNFLGLLDCASWMQRIVCIRLLLGHKRLAARIRHAIYLCLFVLFVLFVSICIYLYDLQPTYIQHTFNIHSTYIQHTFNIQSTCTINHANTKENTILRKHVSH